MEIKTKTSSFIENGKRYKCHMVYVDGKRVLVDGYLNQYGVSKKESEMIIKNIGKGNWSFGRGKKKLFFEI